MRIVVHGQQAFGKAVLEALLERDEDVIAVYVAPDREGYPPDPLKEFALERDLPVHQPASYKTPEVWEAFRSFSPDLCIMAFVKLIVPEEFLNIPTHGSIQYHPSLLPLHRGPSSINWPIIQGVAKTGLSVFWPDNGLDTGPVLLQKEVDIGPDDTLGTVYFDKLFPLGVGAMVEALDLVKKGKAPRIEQDESEATYESWCVAKEVEIDWSCSAQAVHNLIRGADPAPAAWVSVGGQILQLFGATRVDGAAVGAPGEILAIDEAGLTVAAEGGAVRVARLRAEGGKKLAAAEVAADLGMVLGDRLG
jgi:methionyl-tRNA formyltransferase